MIYTTREGVHYSLPEKTRQNAKYGLVGVLALIGIWLGGAGLHIGTPFSGTGGSDATAGGQPVRLTSESNQSHRSSSHTSPPSGATAQAAAPSSSTSSPSTPTRTITASNSALTPQSAATAVVSNPIAASTPPTTSMQGGMGGGSTDSGGSTSSDPSPSSGGTSAGSGAITLPVVGDPTTVVPDTSQTINSLLP